MKPKRVVVCSQIIDEDPSILTDKTARISGIPIGGKAG